MNTHLKTILYIFLDVQLLNISFQWIYKNYFPGVNNLSSNHLKNYYNHLYLRAMSKYETWNLYKLSLITTVFTRKINDISTIA